MKPRPKDLEIMADLLREISETSQTAEVPVAASIFDTQMNLVSQSLNQREMTNDPSAHAEICVLRQAGINNQNWNLVLQMNFFRNVEMPLTDNFNDIISFGSQ